MAKKSLTPPTMRGGEKVKERWELEVSKLLDNTEYSLDDLARLLFLTTSTTQGQENLREILTIKKLITENSGLRAKINSLENKVYELEKQIQLIPTVNLEEIKKKIKDLEVMVWA